MIALYAFDHEIARAPRAVSNALMGEIRLAWWAEVLDEIFEGRPVRHHPVAQALAGAVGRRGLPRAPLEGLIDARYAELGGRNPVGLDRADWIEAVGGGAMQLASRILDPQSPSEATSAPGRLYALGRLGAPAAEISEARARATLAAKAVSVAAFPAVLPAALAGRGGGEVSKRLRLTWSTASGRL